MLSLTARPAATLALLLALAGPAAGQRTATFDDISLPGPNSFYNGDPSVRPGPFVSGGSTFNNAFDATFGSWSGWSVSNVTDTSTAAFTNQYAAYNLPGGGTGQNSANYGVAYAFSPGDASVTLPAGTAPVSLGVTNTTYAALSMLNGDQFAKRFGGASGDDPDFFTLRITGLDAQSQPTGSIDFDLADYRFADNSRDYVVSQWTAIDLTPLGEGTARLSFGLTSSDVGAFGINTPTYFAADNLVVAPVPEPAGLLLAAAVAAGCRRRRAS